MAGRLWSAPNALGVLRLALIPVFVVLVYGVGEAAAAGSPTHRLRTAALATLLASGLTDLADGFLARRLGLVTRFGAVLDAVADKVTQVSALVALTLAGPPGFPALPLWLLGAVLGRDLVLGTGWLLLRRHGRVPVEHELHGKAATVLVFAVLLTATLGMRAEVVLPLAALAAAASLLSAAGYALRGAASGPGP